MYDNLHELVHRTLRRRGLAIDYLREGLASAKRAIDERGLDEAALLNLDGNVRVRLGYLLVLHGELNEAESTLGPLLRHALTNTTGSSEHGLFTDKWRSGFLQETRRRRMSRAGGTGRGPTRTRWVLR